MTFVYLNLQDNIKPCEKSAEVKNNWKLVIIMSVLSRTRGNLVMEINGIMRGKYTE